MMIVEITGHMLFIIKIYQKIISSNNKYCLAMQDLNKQIYNFVSGKRKEVVDFKEFNLPFTDTSTVINYIFKSCLYVFEDDYIQFLVVIGKELNLEIPNTVVDNFNFSNTVTSSIEFKIPL